MTLSAGLSGRACPPALASAVQFGPVKMMNNSDRSDDSLNLDEQTRCARELLDTYADDADLETEWTDEDGDMFSFVLPLYE